MVEKWWIKPEPPKPVEKEVANPGAAQAGASWLADNLEQLTVVEKIKRITGGFKALKFGVHNGIPVITVTLNQNTPDDLKGEFIGKLRGSMLGVKGTSVTEGTPSTYPNIHINFPSSRDGLKAGQDVFAKLEKHLGITGVSSVPVIGQDGGRGIGSSSGPQKPQIKP